LVECHGGVADIHTYAQGITMFFISNAYAQAAPAAQPGAESSLMSIGFMVLIFIVFYFLLIRPQVKRQKEQKAMVDALNKGDEVVTAGGIVGKITDIADQYITVQVASVNGQPVQLSMQRAAVQTLLPKGTVKSL
jgi:preprotein translocase subunit YajC